MTTPKIVVVLRPDGTIEDISVFAQDHRARVRGFHVVEALTEALEEFEARARACLVEKQPRESAH